MITIENEIVINRPAEVVFAAITDIPGWPRWQRSVTESRQTTPGPVGVGTQGVTVRTVIGQRRESTFEVTECTPNHRFAFRSLTGPVSVMGRHTLTPVAGGAQLHLLLEAEPRGFFKVAEPVLANVAKKGAADDLAQLKALLESRP